MKQWTEQNKEFIFLFFRENSKMEKQCNQLMLPHCFIPPICVEKQKNEKISKSCFFGITLFFQYFKLI